jgi:hypothetical protein
MMACVIFFHPFSALLMDIGISGRKGLGLQFELRVLHLQSRHSQKHTCSVFCSGYFGDGVL